MPESRSTQHAIFILEVLSFDGATAAVRGASCSGKTGNWCCCPTAGHLRSLEQNSNNRPDGWDTVGFYDCCNCCIARWRRRRPSSHRSHRRCPGLLNCGDQLERCSVLLDCGKCIDGCGSTQRRHPCMFVLTTCVRSIFVRLIIVARTAAASRDGATSSKRTRTVPPVVALPSGPCITLLTADC